MRSGAVSLLAVFFFSSRRRHTRFDCDWSSDVCSSDLLPDSPGVPGALAELTLTVPFNDPAAVQAVFARRGQEIAAGLAVPDVRQAGVIAPEPGLHEAPPALCDPPRALLVFDQVMTRVPAPPGGAQQPPPLR